MLNKKYLSDYKTEDYIDDKGKCRTKLKYIGNYFTYKESDEKIAEMKKKYLILFALSALCFCFSLVIPNYFTSECMYVSIPTACTFLPLWFMGTTLFNIITSKPPYIRERKDSICDGVAKTSFIGAVFSVAATVGAVVAYIIADKTNIGWSEYAFFTLLCGLLCGFVILFIYRKSVEMQVIG